MALDETQIQMFADWKPRRRRRGQRRLKNELKFTYESCGTLESFNLFITVKAISKLNLGHID